ncbi:MAG: hypothetical protein H7145_14535 [Akkermansiaceae bacterium]|nr:hypothetical protein [Armatimonadota bacterium]
MKKPSFVFSSLLVLALLVTIVLVNARRSAAQVTIKAATPAAQNGSTGEDRKPGSLYGQVLGHDWGAHTGDWARYSFRTEQMSDSAYIHIRYARETPGVSHLRATVDGIDSGYLTLPSTGGWGERGDQFQVVSLKIGPLRAGDHTLRVTAEHPTVAKPRLQPSVPVLDLVGNRTDKNTVGHGVNVALYTGTPSRFFYSTYNLGNVFSIVDGGTLRWFPDYTLIDPHGSSDPLNVNLDQITIDGQPGNTQNGAGATADAMDEQRQVCVTSEDVVVSRVILTNRSAKPVVRRIEIAGDCRGSVDYRGKPGGEKATRRDGDVLVLVDKNAFPSVLRNGLVMAVGASARPVSSDARTPGAYRLAYDVSVPANATKVTTFACAFARDEATAKAHLAKVLREGDPVAKNRTDWKNFYERQIPQFTCSDKGLNELYGFRWFLLKFTLSGGDLGFFKYPVDMEGRQEFQTYCCYSAPFMAFDLNWNNDPAVGFGQLANMEVVAYPDGRFPWYSTPQTNRVPLDHASRSGQSILPWTAWKFYQIHGREDMIAKLYPTMKKDVDWWISDRDADGNGLFSIDHQLETGMDDLDRRWKTTKPPRYEAIDATSYTILNLKAVANMARVLGNTKDADYYATYAGKATRALETILWDPVLERYRDRNPVTGELTDYNSITIFYPLFAGVATKQNLGIIPRYLTNPKEYKTKFPVPALSQTDPEFDPERRYWAGLTWPATNSHVVDGFAETAKRLDRSQMPAAAELFQRVAALHLQPRADFYEHYHPLTGQPLSNFRDYMHSWWIDTILRQVAGMEVQDDGSLVIDALPMGVKFYALRGAPYRGHKVDVLWNDAAAGKGLVVRCDGRIVRRMSGWKPGDAPVRITAGELRANLPTMAKE